jgi:hypothetical protein
MLHWMDKHSFHQFNHANKSPRLVAARPPMTKTKNRRSSPSHALLSLTRRPQLYTSNFRKASPWKQPTARRESKSKKEKIQTLVNFSNKTFSSSLHSGHTPANLLSPQNHKPPPPPQEEDRGTERSREREKQVTQRLTLGDDDDQGKSMSYMQPINLRAATNAQPGDHDPQQTYYMNKEHRIERDREIERELETSVRSGSHAASDRSLNSVPCSSGSSLDWGARW